MMSLEAEDSMENVDLDGGRQVYNYSSAMSGVSLSEETHIGLSADADSAVKEDQNKPPVRNVGADIALEPPSHGDRVFSSFMEGNSGLQEFGGSSRLSSSMNSPAAKEYITVTVNHPLQEQENGSSILPGGNTYYTYLIITKTNIPEYGGSDFSVRRRFRDVVALADELAVAYRGYFIPPRPDKGIVESQVMQKLNFIELRRLSLEKYIARLARHPVIRKSKELKLFLQSEDKLPFTPSIDMASRILDGAVQLPQQLFGERSTILSQQEATQPAKGGRDLIRIFKELRQSLANDWSSSKPLVVEEDKEFLHKKEDLQDLENELSEASQQAESLVKAQQENGEVMGDLGLVLLKLAKFEIAEPIVSDQRVHALDIECVATAAVKTSRFYREANAQSVKHLDCLHEYLGMMQAVHGAFSDRSNALLTLQTHLSDLSSMNNRLEKLSAASSKVFDGDRVRNHKIEELKESVRATEEARELAQKEYDQIKDRNRAELSRFELERHRDFFYMLKGFLHTQVGYAEKIAHLWKKAADELNERHNRT